MAKIRTFIKYWLPTLLWMGVIFTASSDTHSYQHSSRLIEPLLRWLFPHMPQTRIEQIHEFARKCAHLTEYAVFGILLWRALFTTADQNTSRGPAESNTAGSRPSNLARVGIVLAIAAAYASSDEFHQRFVATRTPHVADVFIDTGGAVLGLLCVWLWRKLRRRPTPETSFAAL